MLGEVRKEESLNAGQLFTMDLSAGITEEEGKARRKYPSNERSNGNTIPRTKGRRGEKGCVKRVVCPEKTRLFIIETSRPRWDSKGGGGGIYLTGISSGKLDNRIQPFL